MLAGIGGRTVAEAKSAVSWNEFQDWMAYRESHGPLVLHDRLERSLALVAHTVACTAPRKQGARPPQLADFLPQRGQREEPISLEAAMKNWR